MRKSSVEELLGLSADEFAAYFNSRVAEALEQYARLPSLSSDQMDAIEKAGDDLYEKLQRAKDPHLTAVLRENYALLEEAHIKAALPREPLASLPADLVRSMASYLLPREHRVFIKASKLVNTDLKGTINPERVKAIQKFLQHVAYGQQAEAEAMLRADSSLLTQSGEFTDYSGRRFICSAYEYAHWAKDTHMCRMLAQVDRATGESALDEDTKAILRERIDRMEAIDPTTGEARGLSYWQNGVQRRSAHFDFTPLITALQEYVSGAEGWYDARNWGAMPAPWLKVGKAQRDVPAHVAQEYCRPDRSFDPTPAFTEPTLPRGSLSFYNYSTRCHTDWYPLSSRAASGLGFDFTLARAGGWAMRAEPAQGRGTAAAVDFEAVTRLNKVRTDELEQLRKPLNPPAAARGLAR